MKNKRGKPPLKFRNNLEALAEIGEYLIVGSEHGYTSHQVICACYQYGIRNGKKFSVSRVGEDFKITLVEFR